MKILIWMTLVFLAFSIEASAKLGGIYMDEETAGGEEIVMFANARNNLGEDAGRAKLVVYVPALEVYERSSSFSMSDGMNYGRLMHVRMPEPAEFDQQFNDQVGPREYDVRISLFHGGVVHHRWRTIIVE